ncbi:MAG: hypothetical protein ACOZAO_02505 [Patescibacteria group bacterium]
MDENLTNLQMAWYRLAYKVLDAINIPAHRFGMQLERNGKTVANAEFKFLPGGQILMAEWLTKQLEDDKGGKLTFTSPDGQKWNIEIPEHYIRDHWKTPMENFAVGLIMKAWEKLSPADNAKANPA